MTEATGVPIVNVVPLPAATPGWKTSEFWLKNAATLLSVLFAADVIPTTGIVAKVAIIAALELGSFGYTVMRTSAKS